MVAVDDDQRAVEAPQPAQGLEEPLDQEQRALGLLPQVGSVLMALKLVLVWLLVMLSSAAVAQLIARSARRGDGRR